MTKREHNIKRLMLAASMAIWGTLGPFTREIAVTSGELALYRAVMAVVLIGSYALITGEKIDRTAGKRDLFLLLVTGMAMGINWVLLFQAYRYTTISAATLSYYFAPVLVTAVCPVLFHERLGRKQIICFLMSTVGLVLIIGFGGLSGGGTDGLGILFGLGAAVLYATVIVTNKLIRTVNGIARTVVQMLGAVMILLPYVMATDGSHLSALDTTGWVCLAVVGVIHTGVTYCLYFSSLKDLNGQEAAILSYIDPLVAVLVSFFILHEGMTPLQFLGGALILGFTLWNEKQ